MEADAARREHSGGLGGDAALDAGGESTACRKRSGTASSTTPPDRFRTPSVPAVSRVGLGGIACSPSPSGANILHNDSASGGPLLSRRLVAFGSTHRPQP
ncbi:MAG TPA: hypothetical protein VFB60_26090 [Ktedonobacteraceae bacterium]|nr:hypothetical protein [Ktedonobacteraceae bacterium]